MQIIDRPKGPTVYAPNGISDKYNRAIAFYISYAQRMLSLYPSDTNILILEYASVLEILDKMKSIAPLFINDGVVSAAEQLKEEITSRIDVKADLALMFRCGENYITVKPVSTSISEEIYIANIDGKIFERLLSDLQFFVDAEEIIRALSDDEVQRDFSDVIV